MAFWISRFTCRVLFVLFGHFAGSALCDTQSDPRRRRPFSNLGSSKEKKKKNKKPYWFFWFIHELEQYGLFLDIDYARRPSQKYGPSRSVAQLIFLIEGGGTVEYEWEESLDTWYSLDFLVGLSIKFDLIHFNEKNSPSKWKCFRLNCLPTASLQQYASARRECEIDSTLITSSRLNCLASQ